jgi:hypothetical protein
MLMLVGICVRIRDSNIDYRYVLWASPQSSKEDITLVSIVEWIVNRWIVFLGMNWGRWSEWDAVLVLWLVVIKGSSRINCS